jgi:hypothetical protein
LGLGAGVLSFAAGPERIERAEQASSTFDGEWVEYVASWNGIPLASATVRTSPVVIDGAKHHEVKIAAETWSYLDLIWKMRDTIEAVFEADTIHPRSFVFRQRENRKRLDTIATFDPDEQKWIVQRQKGKKVQDYELAGTRLFDPVSAAFWARTRDFKVGESVPLDVFGGKNRYRLRLNVVGRERIAVKGGEFETYKIVPQVANLHDKGDAEKLREATIWISADEFRLPVRIDSRVSIGNVSIQLVKKRSV